MCALRIRLVARSPGLRRAVLGARRVFATNRGTRDLLARIGPREITLLADNGIPPERLAGAPRRGLGRDGLTLLWVGRLEARKALPLALEALARLRDRPVRLWVAGDGPLRAAWIARAHELGVAERVVFLGRVSPERMTDLYRRADALVFTSLQDSMGSVTLEAVAQGLPVVTLDHQGPGAILPDEAAVKVPVTVPEHTVPVLAAAIGALADDPAQLDRLSACGHAFARTLTWSQRAHAMSAVYHELLGTPGRQRGAA